MSNHRLILCGGLAAPASARGKPVVALDIQQPDGDVTLKLQDISGRMTANMAPVLVDLLEIAAYVYCADQAVTRGGPTSQDFGEGWRRRFKFHIPVRQPDLWSSKPVRTALCETLGFLSEDDYEFNFKKLRREQPAARSQNMGHDRVLTTFLSYGAVAPRRQAQIIQEQGLDNGQPTAQAEVVAQAVLQAMRGAGLPSQQG